MGKLKKVQRFSEERGCPKCGSDGIHSNFCAEAEFSGYAHPRPAHGSGRIHRHCRRCGYDWDEMPLDLSKSRKGEP